MSDEDQRPYYLREVYADFNNASRWSIPKDVYARLVAEYEDMKKRLDETAAAQHQETPA